MIKFKDFTSVKDLQHGTAQIGAIISIETLQDGCFRVWYREFR